MNQSGSLSSGGRNDRAYRSWTMKIEKQSLGMVKTNVYTVINEETREAFVIDPADNIKEFIDSFQEKEYHLVGILLTHGHFDHIMGVEGLVEKYACPVYALTEELELLGDASLNCSASIRRPVTLKDVIGLNHNQEIQLAGIKIRVIGTPGHTAGGACYYIEERAVLFSGDTLFWETIGRTDLPTGSYGTLVRSVKEQLAILPEETIVYPGHMCETSIEYEKQNNPYM